MVALSLAAAACSRRSHRTPAPDGGGSEAGTASATPSASASASALARTPRTPDSHQAGPTAEQVKRTAREHVDEAAKLAGAGGGKDVCPAVLPLLDVSFSLVRADAGVDPRSLGIFAECAAHAEHWQLLRDLADALSASDRKHPTHFLPRALIGQADYEPAHTLTKAMLRAWPTEGAAYDTGALAALRVRDFEGAVKATDQALLLQRKHPSSEEVTALAHALHGAAALRLGKADEGLREMEATRGHEGVLLAVDVTLEAARAAKARGLLVTVDAPGEIFPALAALYEKRVSPLGGVASVVLQNLADKPLPVVVEAKLAGAECAPKTDTVVKGRPVTVALDLSWKAESPLANPKAAEPKELVVTVTGGADHVEIYRETRTLTFAPRSEIPRVLRAHGVDRRSAFPLDAAWVTPGAPAVAALVAAANKRAGDGATGDVHDGPSLPRVHALWDELRQRGVSFERDPAIDSEARTSEPCRLPAEVLARGSGNALESSLLFASLLEAMGLDVVLVRTPGHRMVGWIGTKADVDAHGTPALVKSPRGPAYFLETTTVGEGPFDAAVLQGAAAWVAATNDGSVSSGRAEVERISDLRHRGIAPRAE